MNAAAEIERMRDRIAELEELLGLRIPVPPAFAPRRANFSRGRMWALICFLAKREFVSHEAITVALWGDIEIDQRPNAKGQDVYICHLRKFLRAYDIELRTAWGKGWYFDAVNRRKVRALIEQLCASAGYEGA